MTSNGEQNRLRVIDLSDLPELRDSEGYVIVAQGPTKKIIGDSDRRGLGRHGVCRHSDTVGIR